MATLTHAQTAKVVQLSPADAAEAKSLYEQKAAIEKKIADLQERISHQYVSDEKVYPTSICISGVSVLHPDGTTTSFPSVPCTTLKPTPEQEKASHYFTIKSGWENGFEFSDEFKFVVPKAYKEPTSCYHYSGGTFVSPGTITF